MRLQHAFALWLSSAKQIVLMRFHYRLPLFQCQLGCRRHLLKPDILHGVPYGFPKMSCLHLLKRILRCLAKQCHQEKAQDWHR